MPCLVLICWKFFIEVWSRIGFHHLLHALLEVLLFEELWNLSLFEITDISSLFYLIHWIVCLPLWIIYQFFFMLALLWNSWLVMKLLATKWKIHLHKLNYTTNFVLWVVWLMTISVFFSFCEERYKTPYCWFCPWCGWTWKPKLPSTSRKANWTVSSCFSCWAS